jgi:hypothetical protein
MPGSVLAHMAGLQRPRWTDSYAIIRAHAADDHLLTLSGLLVGELIPRASCYTVLRGALEADAWAFWALAPDKDQQERWRRQAIDRLFSAAQRRTATGGRVKGMSQRVTLALRQADRAGVLDATRLANAGKPSPSRGKLLRLVLQRERPKVTDVISEALAPWNEPHPSRPRGAVLYQVLSGYAHGEIWAHMMGHSAQPVQPGQGFTDAELNLQVDFLLAALRWAVL